MAKFIKRLSKQAGLVPGTLVHIGEKKTESVKITVFDYDAERFQEKVADKAEDIFPFKDTPTVTWVNIDGVHETSVIEKIGKHFELHPLVQEDIVNTGQRPKLEDFEKYIFVSLKMLYYDKKQEGIIIEQVSLVIGSNFVISFQEQEGDVFNPIRERIRQAKGRIRKMGSDYLAYALIDSIVDNYFSILEKFGEDMEKAEEDLAVNPQPEVLNVIHKLKRDAILLRKSVWPLREIISGLQRGESSLIKENTSIYFRDVYDHTIQVVDTIEAFRDMVSGLLDIYLSSMSNKMNEIMKVLTIFAAIFIPLTFFAGIYGMNFKYMPELEWHYGYFMVLGFMGIVGISLLFYFKRKKWM
ncbi:MAG: magnesium/cobalt transporter CorA [Candidatus Omnitrophota bacterium]